jgi:DNA-binding NarL/FixJ family response regulator
MTPCHEIRILMVDDHGLFREGLGRLLNATPGFRVVAQCSSVAEAMAALAEHEVDVVLLDYDLGEETGTELLSQMNKSGSKARVLLVTAGLTDAVTLQALQAGSAGVFLKHSSPDQLVVAIQQVAKGEIWLDKGSVRSLMTSKAKPQGTARQLTYRQSEVLRGILDGLANKEIAWRLKSSESAVKAVIQELFHKAGVRTRSQLVRIAIEKHSSDWLRSE